jgi:hypothetical protein
MSLVEIWTIGGLDSSSFVIIEPYYGGDEEANGYVINGHYDVIRKKEINKLKIIGAPGGSRYHEAHYLGDVMHKGDYNQTICDYLDTRKVVGHNLIKVEKPKDKEPWTDEPAF